jgi:predicted transcriptional regulator of viral defense system
MSAVSDLIERFRREPAFSARDAQVFFRARKVSPAYRNLLLHNLVRKGKLFRIAKGRYTFRDEMQSVGFAFQPFYYGLQDALSLRNLWEQETVPVVITARRVRSGLRKFAGGNYLVRRISRRMFFGFEAAEYGDFWIPVSDAEKTLIDLVYFRQPISDETIVEIRKVMRKEVMREYLKRVPKWVEERVRKKLGRKLHQP